MENELKAFDYELPQKLIAQTPAKPRDNARLLVYKRTHKTITDDYFYNLPKHLPTATTLVLNDSKVIKARLKFDKTEVFITRKLDDYRVEALVYPGKKFQSGTSVNLAYGISADVENILDDGQRVLKFSVKADNSELDKFRHTPFPPYIKPDETYAGQYQTVYSAEEGGLAAPTAGLHFTEAGLKAVEDNYPVVRVTLHVGLGTFAPLKEQNLRENRLHSEDYQINPRAAQKLNQAKHITAVGTTVTRVLESAVSPGHKFKSGPAVTRLFVRPGYNFKAVDALITNFHLPKSSLLMLVGAFMGIEEMQMVYKHAINEKYRFYSFGDAMLII